LALPNTLMVVLPLSAAPLGRLRGREMGRGGGERQGPGSVTDAGGRDPLMPNDQGEVAPAQSPFENALRRAETPLRAARHVFREPERSGRWAVTTGSAERRVG